MYTSSHYSITNIVGVEERMVCICTEVCMKVVQLGFFLCMDSTDRKKVTLIALAVSGIFWWLGSVCFSAISTLCMLNSFQIVLDCFWFLRNTAYIILSLFVHNNFGPICFH